MYTEFHLMYDWTLPSVEIVLFIPLSDVSLEGP